MLVGLCFEFGVMMCWKLDFKILIYIVEGLKVCCRFGIKGCIYDIYWVMFMILIGLE